MEFRILEPLEVWDEGRRYPWPGLAAPDAKAAG